MWSSSQNRHHCECEARGGTLQPILSSGSQVGSAGDGPVQFCPSLAEELVPRRWQNCCSTVLAIGARTSFSLWDARGCPDPEGQVSAQLSSSWRPQERIHCFAFSNFEKLPIFLSLWLRASSVMTDVCSCPIPFSVHACLMYGPCGDTGPTWIIQDHLNPIAPAKCFLPCEVPCLHSWFRWTSSRATGWAVLGRCLPGSGATAQQALLCAWPLSAPALPSTRPGSGRADKGPKCHEVFAPRVPAGGPAALSYKSSPSCARAWLCWGWLWVLVFGESCGMLLGLGDSMLGAWPAPSFLGSCQQLNDMPLTFKAPQSPWRKQ